MRLAVRCASPIFCAAADGTYEPVSIVLATVRQDNEGNSL